MTAYKRLLQELLNADVSFLIVGGYAAIAHGLTRATDDLNVWIEPTLENAKRTLKALRAMGLPAEDWTAESIANPYSFGEETGRKVDIMFGEIRIGRPATQPRVTRIGSLPAVDLVLHRALEPLKVLFDETRDVLGG